MTDPTALTALAEQLEALATPLEERERYGYFVGQSQVVREAAATLRALASPATPATEGQTQEQRDEARAMARRIIGNCSGESLVEAIADIKMFGEFDPLKPWHVRPRAEGQGHAATPAWERGGFFKPCNGCKVATHCAHHRRCLAECVPADLAPPAALDREALVSYDELVEKARAIAHELARRDKGFTDAGQFRRIVQRTADDLLALLRPAPVSKEP